MLPLESIVQQFADLRPPQNRSGVKERSGRIACMGDRYLRHPLTVSMSNLI
ncbi:transposase [Methylobacterium sp. NPDC080182]|uniref:transposase n=1 Tax=Methylobacterium sp. NPDC080182 TaxID=3390590 RepID=UPI003D05B5C5